MISDSWLKITIILAINLLIGTGLEQGLHTFPQIVWSFWDKGFQSASLFTKLCFENKRTTAEQSGWEFRLINSSSIGYYLNLTKFDQVFNRLPQKKPQKKANLVRLMLMMEHGGMWIDADTYFLRNLSWADWPQQSSLLHNKIGPGPEVVIGAYSQGELTFIDDPYLNQTINVFPGLQNWFLMAKPGSEFFQDMWNTLMEVLKDGKEVVDERIARENITFYYWFMNPYFFMSDYIEAIVLHRKQNQIKAKPTSSNPIQRYAVGHYKLWHFEAPQTCFHHLKQYSSHGKVTMWFDVIGYSAKEVLGLTQKTSKKEEQELPFFMKYAGWQYAIYDFFLEHHTTFNCWGLSHTIDPNSEIGIFLFSEANTQRLSDEVRPILEPLSGAEGYCRTHVRGGMERSSMRGVVWVVLYLVVPGLTLSVYVLVCWWGAWRRYQSVDVFESISIGQQEQRIPASSD